MSEFDTTVFNSTVMIASLSPGPVLVSPGTDYLFDALVVYSTSRAAGLRYEFMTWPRSRLQTKWIPGDSRQSIVVHDEFRSVLIDDPGDGGVLTFRERGLLTVGAEGGLVELRFAQDTADLSHTIIRAGTWMVLSEVSD